MSPETAEEIVPSVVVVVADADAGLPAGASEAGFLGDVCERSVAIIFVQMRDRSFARRPVGIEARSVCEIDVEPAVMVVIKKSEAAAFRLDDVLFVIDAAPYIGREQAGFTSHIDELDRRGSCWIRNRWIRRGRGFKPQRATPFPEWSRENVQKRTSEYD